MPGLNITVPRPDTSLISEQDFDVSGIAFDRGWPEPTMIDSVSVRVDDGPATEAALSPGQPSGQTVVNFTARLRAPAAEGAHTVIATATNDIGRSVTRPVTVYVGRGPMWATFSGTSTLRTTHPRD